MVVYSESYIQTLVFTLVVTLGLRQSNCSVTSPEADPEHIIVHVMAAIVLSLVLVLVTGVLIGIIRCIYHSKGKRDKLPISGVGKFMHVENGPCLNKACLYTCLYMQATAMPREMILTVKKVLTVHLLVPVTIIVTITLKYNILIIMLCLSKSLCSQSLHNYVHLVCSVAII